MTQAWQDAHPQMLSWLKGQVGDEAQDVLHDVLVRAFTNLDALEPVRDLGAWLWRALRNRVIDQWRSRARRGSTQAEVDDFDLLVDDLTDSAQDELEEEELLDELEAAIDRLSPEHRQVIVAQGLNGESFASLSARTGIAPETLASRKRSALARLRQDLEDFS